MLHFLLGFLQSRNIVEHALEQRETAFFPDFFGLDMHPDRMAVLMLLAEFKSAISLRASAWRSCPTTMAVSSG